MVKARSSLKILLLQIRNDTLTRLEELDEFVRYSRLGSHQLTVLDVYETPEFEPSQIVGFDALFVGGSSDASVTQPDIYPFVASIERLLVYCIDHRIPVFASCFGFQAAVTALGGKVIVDKSSMEMGTYPLWLTPAATQDLLFHDVPNGFWAVSGHKERAIAIPENAILLAYSDRCPFHAFKILDRPFYGFQFHPEMNAQELAVRISRYRDRYLDNQAVLDQILSDLQETPIANQLIERFVDRVLLSE
ncbi:MAG: type 1 glutamine amidotransferase [Leptolyngbyaceae cyanobacterium CSU_1_3]|nr:type 1 glutamine amidotransferase [Leptolyngbyaceae cyanobacterium CSU_1_3]